MGGLFKIFNDIQTEEWTDYEILKDFTENEQTGFCYDWAGFDHERVLPAITNILKENQQLKKQKDDVVEYIKSNCILSDEWTELDFCNFVPTGKINYKALNKEKVKDLLRMLGEIDE